MKNLWLALWLLVIAGGKGALAAAVVTDHTEVELLAENSAVVPGEPFWIAYRLEAVPQWHTYWRNPGDSGLPSKIDWQLPPGWQIGELHWPYPELVSTPPFATHAYHGEVLLLAKVTPPAELSADSVTLGGEAAWLVCKDLCLRETASLQLTLPVAATAVAVNKARFDHARQQWPQSLADWQFNVTRHGQQIYLAMVGPGPLPGPIHFFPNQGDQIEPSAPQTLFRTDTGYRLQLAVSQYSAEPFDRLDGVLVASASWHPSADYRALKVFAEISAVDAAPEDGVSVSSRPGEVAGVGTRDDAGASTGSTAAGGAHEQDSTMGLGLALLLAFMGGAILNLMPCVFPVLSIKVLSFIDMAQGHKGHVRRHGLLFALGILLSFWLLSGLMVILQQAGAEIGWGFQLQSPGFVIALSLLLFLLALNLLGVFEMGGTVMRIAGNADTGSGYSSSFFTGVLAAAVATPCTAPFMGAALGYALTQSPQTTLLIFTALALGLASPYLLLAEIPGLLEKLPRPGSWMVTFRRLLAFPLFASAIWLGWVLGHQQGVDAVALLMLAMLVLALAGWLHGMQQQGAGRRRWVDGVLAVLLLTQIPLWQQMMKPVFIDQAAVESSAWEAYDPDRLAGYLAGGEAVFIDFTAAWCITCQVNKLALNSATVSRYFADNSIRTIRADWTREDPAITAALAAVGRNGVPTYLYYDSAGNTRLLPELLTAELIIDALAD